MKYILYVCQLFGVFPMSGISNNHPDMLSKNINLLKNTRCYMVLIYLIFLNFQIFYEIIETIKTGSFNECKY